MTDSCNYCGKKATVKLNGVLVCDGCKKKGHPFLVITEPTQNKDPDKEQEKEPTPSHIIESNSSLKSNQMPTLARRL